MKLDKTLKEFLMYEISNYEKYKNELKNFNSMNGEDLFRYTGQYIKRIELTVQTIDNVLNALSPEQKLIFENTLLSGSGNINTLSNELNYSISSIYRCKSKIINEIAKGLGIIF